MKGKKDKQEDIGDLGPVHHGYEVKKEKAGSIEWEYLCDQCFRDDLGATLGILEAPPIKIRGRYQCCRCGKIIDIT